MLKTCLLNNLLFIDFFIKMNLKEYNMTKKPKIEEIIEFIKSINFNDSSEIEKGEDQFKKIIKDIIEKDSYDLLEKIIDELNIQKGRYEKLLNSLNPNEKSGHFNEKEKFKLRGKINRCKSLNYIIGKELLESDLDELYDKYFKIEEVNNDQKNQSKVLNEKSAIKIKSENENNNYLNSAKDYLYFVKNNNGKYVFNRKKQDDKEIDFTIFASQLVHLNNNIYSQSIVTQLMKIYIFDFTRKNWTSIKTYIKTRKADKPKNKNIISEIENILNEFGYNIKSLTNL
jgi:hypothetical protein